MLLKGDCRQQLATLPDNSIHAIITDPPYELGFMGKTWDSTGIAYNLEVWQQCLRVLKPGGHLLAFGGSRTYHRLACAIEDAGFEIRDQIMWVYGSGFPKSLDVSKAIDKAAGAQREVIEQRKFGARSGDGVTAGASNGGIRGGFDLKDNRSITAPATDAAKQWDGWGTALKPAHEPIVLARKPLDGTVANNVLTHGVGALNIDDCRVGETGGGTTCDHRDESGRCLGHPTGNRSLGGGVMRHGDKYEAGRWPANFIHDGSDQVLELFPHTKTGTAVRRNIGKSNRGMFAFGNQGPEEDVTYDDGGSGSAARFFYCAKASRTERNTGLDELEEKKTTGGGGLTVVGGAYGSIKAKQQNFHPTVKPLALIHYLIKLITPPGGTILDPFLGSGTTAVAATQLGHPWIGCELTEDYWPIIEARIAHATQLT
jgi:site-specific DNA-methyltransferase (adenine-specific)